MKENVYSDLYFRDSVDKQIVIEVVGTGISIDNSMIEQGAFSLTETLCSQSELKFGICEANRFTVIVHDMPRSIKGETVVVREYLDGHMDNPFPYGIYKVYSDVPTSDRTKREITAYDAMYDILNAYMKQWYAGLTFPMTLRQFRDSFFAHFGITQKETTLVNDGMTVNKTLVAEQTDPDSTITAESAISGKAVIEAICEINGVFGNINRDGQFEYVELKEIISPLYPANDLYPSDDLFLRDPNTISMTGHYITFDYEDFQTKKVTQLEIRPSDDSAGAAVGTSGNNYVISGNFLVSDKTGTELEAIAANTLSIIRKASYTPLKSSEVVGNPCIELGDPIRFNTTREIVESYVLQRTLTGIQNKRDSIVSPGTETYNQNPNSIRDQISSVERRTNKLERTADHTLSELSDLDKNTSSRFEQAAEQIQMEVTRATGAESALSSGITQNAESISAEVSNRQNADNEMSTKISQSAHSIALVATGGDNSVGITIQLYDQNGNLIDTDSGNANITIVGVVKFEDLQNAGQTVINGANILTGTVTADKLVAGALTAGRVETSDGSVIIDSGVFQVASGTIYVGTINSTEIGTNYISSGTILASDQLYSSGTMYSAGDITCSGSFVGNLSGNSSSASYADKAKMCTETATQSHTSNCFIKDMIVYYCPQGSARRFKTDIEPVVDAGLDPHRLYNINVVQFKYKPSFYNLPEGTDMPTVIGMLADDIDQIYPCACEYDDETGEVINWLERYMIPPMLALIQEQHADIESLKQENLALQNRLSILEQKMEVLENVINNQNN